MSQLTDVLGRINLEQRVHEQWRWSMGQGSGTLTGNDGRMARERRGLEHVTPLPRPCHGETRVGHGLCFFPSSNIIGSGSLSWKGEVRCFFASFCLSNQNGSGRAARGGEVPPFVQITLTVFVDGVCKWLRRTQLPRLIRECGFPWHDKESGQRKGV